MPKEKEPLPTPSPESKPRRKEKKKRVELLNVLRDERLKKKKCKPFAVLWCEPEIEISSIVFEEFATSVCFIGAAVCYFSFFLLWVCDNKKSAKTLRAGTRKVCKLKGNVTATRKKDQTEVKEKMEDETE